jgi:hypothetical protein
MTSNTLMKTSFLFRLVGRFLTVLVMAAATNAMALDPDQSRLAAPAGDGWQMLSGTSLAKGKGTPTDAPANDALAPSVATSINPVPMQISGCAPTVAYLCSPRGTRFLAEFCQSPVSRKDTGLRQ